jgi:hypothetical protein
MTSSGSTPPPVPVLIPAASPERTLRKLFLTLFLRGRGARGLRKESAPKSVGSKLAFTLAFYALIGLVALAFRNQPIFTLSVYLHAMTMMFLGMFVAASAGEVLFNKEEASDLRADSLYWRQGRALGDAHRRAEIRQSRSSPDRGNDDILGLGGNRHVVLDRGLVRMADARRGAHCCSALCGTAGFGCLHSLGVAGVGASELRRAKQVTSEATAASHVDINPTFADCQL